MAMTLRLSDDQTNRLREAAAREGLSMQAAALKAVDDYVSQHTTRRDELITQMMRDHAGLFKRLADS